jgi:hypothetical protein
MQKTVWALAHRLSGETLKIYRTQAGARIAQRARNSLLGFRLRRERLIIDDLWEVELCEIAEGTVEQGTWMIREITVDQEDLTEYIESDSKV